jgi:metallo-beta-lactamase class B
MPSFPKRKIVVAIALSAISLPAFCQTAIPPAQTFPNEDVAKTSDLLNEARQIAGDDLYPHFMRRCVLSQIYSLYANSAEAPLQMDPIQVFDNLYFIGQGAVSAWAVKTSAGLVIIDALNNAAEAEDILVGGLRRLGLNPADMRYLIITHEHGDHFGGARYLQDTYGVQLVASDPAWNTMDDGTASSPRRNVTVSDVEHWTVGDTTFLFTVTPGHTPGALSTIFSVYDHGKRHVGALYGGFGIPASAENKILQIQSLDRFADITRREHVDTLLANHQTQDLSLYNHDLLRHRRVKRDADPESSRAHDFKDPHPYVIGQRSYQRYLALQSVCVRVSAARNGQDLGD